MKPAAPAARGAATLGERGRVVEPSFGEIRIPAFLRAPGAIVLCLLALAPPARADLIVPANGVVDLAGGTVDLACTDLVVAGTLQVGGGAIVNARNVTIQ